MLLQHSLPVKNQENYQNGFHIPIQLLPTRISQFVSVKIKINNETTCVFRLANLSALSALNLSYSTHPFVATLYPHLSHAPPYCHPF